MDVSGLIKPSRHPNEQIKILICCNTKTSFIDGAKCFYIISSQCFCLWPKARLVLSGSTEQLTGEQLQTPVQTSTGEQYQETLQTETLTI